MNEPWTPGQVISRREILGYEPTSTVDPSLPWFGGCWLEIDTRVVRDEPDELVLYVPAKAPMSFPVGDWPIPGGQHPWAHNARWQGPGCLMLHRPGEHHAIWHFWNESGSFSHWYINVQTDFRRAGVVFESCDLELDFVIAPDHSWQVKDWDDVDARVDEGRFTAELAAWIHDYGRDIMARLEAEGPWWDLGWAEWTPPSGWE